MAIALLLMAMGIVWAGLLYVSDLALVRAGKASRVSDGSIWVLTVLIPSFIFVFFSNYEMGFVKIVSKVEVVEE